MAVGNFRIEARLGAGGMGEVFLARHQKLGSLAAIKVLLPEMCQKQEVVRRFENEARAVTAIRHPSIVEIYDFVQLPDGRACIIMEYLQGETLAARLSRVRKMAFSVALQLARQIAGALAAAHAAGIVHRDLKPENVFLIQDPEIIGGERIKLLDFGIAKLSEKLGDDASPTRTGQALGTPGYMSPEQCRGASDLDGRADLYSLGCVMYRLLCGRPPFAFEAEGEVLAHHLYFEPDPPRKHAPEVPAEVEALVLGLLAKKPAQRPASASALIRAIDELAFVSVSAEAHDGPLPTFELADVAPTLATKDLKAPSSPRPEAAAPAPLPPEPSNAAVGESLLLESAARRRPWRRLGAAAAVVAGAGAMWLFAQARDRAPAQSPAVAAPAPALADVVTLRFVVSPAEARDYQVHLAGELVPSRVILAPRSHTQALQIEISAPGYASERRTIMPSESRDYPIALAPLPPVPPPAPEGDGAEIADSKPETSTNSSGSKRGKGGARGGNGGGKGRERPPSPSDGRDPARKAQIKGL